MKFKKALLGSIIISIVVFCVAELIYFNSLTAFPYKKIDFSVYESDAFRHQYAGEGLAETTHSLDSVNDVIASIQEKSHRASDERNLINRLLIELDNRMTYTTGYAGSHADAIVEGKGTCYHYAYLFYLLTDSFGFESEVLYGKINDDLYHTWNRIWLDEQWWYFDPTGTDQNRRKWSWLSEKEYNDLCKVKSFKVVYSKKLKDKFLTKPSD